MTEANTVPLVGLPGEVLMPLVGFGTWQMRGDRCYEAVRVALETGYRHIDTATMYGNEAEVGRALRDSGLDRAEVFLTTKLMESQAGAERATIAASLRALGTDHLDLWLIHWPPSGSSGVPVWREFLAVRDAGLTRTVGVSNYGIRQIDELVEATGEAPAVNQIPWSPPRHDPRLLDQHRERGVAVEGYSPLKGTRLRTPALVEIAQRHRVTSAQVVLRWHLQHDITVIPKSARPDRIRSNFDLFGFTLDDAEMARIDALSGH